MIDFVQDVNAREAAYLSLLGAAREEGFLAELLEGWQRQTQPSNADFGLAKEIAYGTMRRMLSLDYIGKSFCKNGKLSLKHADKLLLFTALYQLYFMDRIPKYAIINETIEIGKKHCHKSSIPFLNAVLRNASDKKLPKGDRLEELSVRYSYPKFAVQQFIKYGLKEAKEIMEAMNFPGITTFRKRPGMEVFVLKDDLKKIAASKEYYIQNFTPASLMDFPQIDKPKSILDLCAAPGGKLLAAHDRFPEAKLYANDISDKKIELLEKNIKKYGLDVSVSCCRGENFKSKTEFDLIIVDVPCSNSGVLNKRPEARWRISEKSIESLTKTQMDLISNAAKLLSPNGQIWYMTCSIFEQENEKLVEKAAQKNNLHISSTKLILPNKDGWDSGFIATLQR